jgi:hypothetical protein
MLVGIVAMQVELLKLNADTGRSIELTNTLQSRNDILRAQVAAASDPNRIERLASHLGMTMPGPESITFLKARSAAVRRALAQIRAPNLAAFEAALRASNAAAALRATSPQTNASASAGGERTNGTPARATTAPARGAAQATGTPTTPTTSATAAPSTSSSTAAAGTSTGAQTGATSAPPATVP